MKNHMKGLIILLFGVSIWSACKKEEITPSPADTIVGFYRIKSANVYYSSTYSAGLGWDDALLYVKKNNDTLVDMSIGSDLNNNKKIFVFHNIVVKDKPKDNLSSSVVYFLYDNSITNSYYEWVGYVENDPKLKFSCFAKDTVSKRMISFTATFAYK